MTWNGDDFLKDVKKELGQRVEKAAIHLVNEIKKNLNEAQPYHITKSDSGRKYVGEDPSQPGDFPKKVRGDLQRSITYAMADDKQSAKVGTNLDYGFFLEVGTSRMQPRPYLVPTFLEEQPVIAKILGA